MNSNHLGKHERLNELLRKQSQDCSALSDNIRYLMGQIEDTIEGNGADSLQAATQDIVNWCDAYLKLLQELRVDNAALSKAQEGL